MQWTECIYFTNLLPRREVANKGSDSDGTLWGWGQHWRVVPLAAASTTGGVKPPGLATEASWMIFPCPWGIDFTATLVLRPRPRPLPRPRPRTWIEDSVFFFSARSAIYRLLEWNHKKQMSNNCQLAAYVEFKCSTSLNTISSDVSACCPDLPQNSTEKWHVVRWHINA